MYAMIVVLATLIGQSQGPETKMCIYRYQDVRYTHIIPVTQTCPQTIQVNYE